MKRRIIALFLMGLLALTAAGCGDQGAASGSNDGAGSGLYTPGTYTAESQGFGGTVAVTVTFDANNITDVSIDAPDETPTVGGEAIEPLIAAVKESNSADFDSVSGATMTSTAVKNAVADCIAQAKGESVSAEETAVKMAPGTYEAYAESYRAKDGLNVTVEVSETEILSISVDKENTSDTPTILQAAIDKLIPRMIEHQSVAIDAITGATASSNAIKAAAQDALQQALEAGGSDANAIKQFQIVPEKTGGSETIDTDVLVIGMGGSGTTAALSAAESGLKVLAIDKAGKYGGTSSITSEGLFVNPERFQAEHNNGEDYTDADVMLHDWLEYTEGDAKEEVVSRMIYESGQVLDWLVYDHGVGFAEPMTGFTPTDVYVTKYQWLPNDIMYNKDSIGKYFDRLWSDFEAEGGTYMLETEAYELINDEATHTVTGAKARNLADGTEYTIHAKAVVIATGGYLGSAELQKQFLRDDYYPLTGTWSHLGSLQNDGKMIQAALDADAGTYNISMPPEVHNSGTSAWLTTQFDAHYIDGEVGEITGRPAFWTEGDLPANMGWSPDSLAVNSKGERFTAETGVSFLDPWIAGPEFYSIWSAEQIEKLKTEGFDTDRSGPSASFLGSGTPIPMGTPIPNVDAVLEAAENANILVKADTIEELAGKLKIDPAVLSSTVDTYNSYCETGVDEQFNKPAEYLDKIGAGPYYGVTIRSYAYGSCGGLNINEHLQVIASDGTTPITGLYAVGTDAMGVLFTEKKPYVTYGGANNGWGMVSGYLCGKELADVLQ